MNIIQQIQLIRQANRQVMLTFIIKSLQQSLKQEKDRQKQLTKELKKKKENNSSFSTKYKHWNSEELYKLAMFLAYNGNAMATSALSKNTRAYRSLSLFINTRNKNQCRRYASNLFTVFQTIQKINAYFQRILPFYDQVVPLFKNEVISILVDKKMEQSSLIDERLRQILERCEKRKTEQRKVKDNSECLQVKVEVKQQVRQLYEIGQEKMDGQMIKQEQVQRERQIISTRHDQQRLQNVPRFYYNFMYYPFYMPAFN